MKLIVYNVLSKQQEVVLFERVIQDIDQKESHPRLSLIKKTKTF